MQNLDLNTKTNYLIEFYQDSYVDNNDTRSIEVIKKLRMGTLEESRIHEDFDLFISKEKEFLLKFFKKASGASLSRGLLIGLENDAFTPSQIHGMAEHFGEKLRSLVDDPESTTDE